MVTNQTVYLDALQQAQRHVWFAGIKKYNKHNDYTKNIYLSGDSRDMFFLSWHRENITLWNGRPILGNPSVFDFVVEYTRFREARQLTKENPGIGWTRQFVTELIYYGK